MDYFIDFITNKYIFIPFLLWLGIQLFKVLWDYKRDRKFNIKRFLGAGGMPSSHSAVVCSLATLIGKEYGLNSAIFGLSVILALVVMYDAAGVRRAAGNQARLLNKIIENPELNVPTVQGRLVEVLGHNPKEVFVGAVIGIFVGVVL